jgi:predicted small lipoprotein YifL
MPIRTLIVIVLAVAALSGCGRRGTLEEPTKVETNAVPTAASAPPPSADYSPLDPGTSRTPAPASPPKPAAKKGFFLDFLL